MNSEFWLSLVVCCGQFWLYLAVCCSLQKIASVLARQASILYISSSCHSSVHPFLRQYYKIPTYSLNIINASICLQNFSKSQIVKCSQWKQGYHIQQPSQQSRIIPRRLCHLWSRLSACVGQYSGQVHSMKNCGFPLLKVLRKSPSETVMRNKSCSTRMMWGEGTKKLHV